LDEETIEESSDIVKLTTVHQEALIIACLIWHFEKNSFIPGKLGKYDPDKNKLFPSKNAVEYLGNTAYAHEYIIFDSRKRYMDSLIIQPAR